MSDVQAADYYYVHAVHNRSCHCRHYLLHNHAMSISYKIRP